MPPCLASSLLRTCVNIPIRVSRPSQIRRTLRFPPRATEATRPTCPRTFTSTSSRKTPPKYAPPETPNDQINLRSSFFPPTATHLFQGQIPPGPERISLRPLYFAIATCLGSFYIADKLDERSDAKFIEKLKEIGWRSGTREVARQRVGALEKKRTLAWLGEMGAPSLVRQVYSAGKDWWTAQDDGQKAVLIIIAMNTVPFLAWRVPSVRVRAFMERCFVGWPGVNPGFTLLTSVFSHESFVHYAFNMIALYSFGPPALSYLRQKLSLTPSKQQQQQKPKPPPSTLSYIKQKLSLTQSKQQESQTQSSTLTTLHKSTSIFLLFGILSNLLPHYLSLLTLRVPFLLGTRAALALIPRPGRGASGAVYGFFAITALAHPQALVSIIFLPFVSVPIGYGFPAMLAVDAFGVLRGWHKFGHLTHLTGAGLGAGAFWWVGKGKERGGERRVGERRVGRFER